MRYDWTVEIDGDDVSQWVKASGTIDYGKPSRFTGFQAPTAVFTLFTKDENPKPAPPVWPTILLGAPVIIHVTVDGVTQFRRFSGVVQSLDWRLYGLTVTATGGPVDGLPARAVGPYWTATDWQTLIAGETGNLYPITDQDEVTRVRWLVESTGLNIETEGVPARRVRGIPKNTPGQPLLDAVLRVADDCDALLMMDRLGVMRYRTKNFTRPARVNIPAHVVESTTIDMAIERGTVINQVTVYYGEPDPVTGNQNTVSDQNTQSIIELGERRTDLYTDIQYEGGARGKAADYLIRQAQSWEMPDVTLLMTQATETEAESILDWQEGWRVRVTNLPAGCPIPEYDADILGFTDIMHETDYRIILHLSPPFGTDTDIPEEPIFAQDSCTGGREVMIEDQYGFLWQTHIFDTAGDFTLTCNEPVTGMLLAVGGGAGGGGGSLSYEAGGGGAGALFEQEVSLTPGTQTITVGAGGGGGAASTRGGTGGTTKFNQLWVYGGGGGGRGGRNTQAAGDGGFGGGSGADAGNAPGVGLYGSLDGGVTTNKTLIRGGNGNPSDGNRGGSGGGASYQSDITGTTVTYSVAGPGGQNNETPTPGATPGSGGKGGGYPSATGGAGYRGIVVYAYRVA